MRHYEIAFLVHPDQSQQVPGMIERYSNMITDSGGKVHRTEDWGRRQLAYPINKIHKAHYILLNIECDQTLLKEITTAFKFNDAVLRNLIIKRDSADTGESPLMKLERESKEKKLREEQAEEYRQKRALAAAAASANKVAQETPAPDSSDDASSDDASSDDASPDDANPDDASSDDASSDDANPDDASPDDASSDDSSPEEQAGAASSEDAAAAITSDNPDREA